GFPDPFVVVDDDDSRRARSHRRTRETRAVPAADHVDLRVGACALRPYGPVVRPWVTGVADRHAREIAPTEDPEERGGPRRGGGQGGPSRGTEGLRGARVLRYALEEARPPRRIADLVGARVQALARRGDGCPRGLAVAGGGERLRVHHADERLALLDA